jgi:ABC-2 type transport system ATP-binding protein
MATLEVRNLVKRYRGIPAVQDVSFTLRSGEILGYLGHNGAGKSTTVKMIIGLLEPSGGEILFDGRSVMGDLQAFQRRLGYVPEEPVLYPHLSGREYLQLVGRLRGLPRVILESKIDEFLRLFGLYDDRHCTVSAYSKGMRQKVLLSAALLHNPDLLVLDEPLSGLDAMTAMVMKEVMRSLAAKNCMIFYSSHVLEVVEKVCSRVMILQRGRVIADDSVARIREMTRQASLEGAFAQLAQQESPESIAGQVIEVMRA